MTEPTAEDIRTAGRALGLLSTLWPMMPKPDDMALEAWSLIIAEHNLGWADVRAAIVTLSGDELNAKPDFRPTPPYVVKYARAIRRDRLEREGPSDDYRALCDSKAAPDDDPELMAANRARLAAAVGDVARRKGLDRDLETIKRVADKHERQAGHAP